MSADPRPVKLLLDENLSPWAAAQLRDAGIDAVHVRDRGLLGASDTEVLQQAFQEDRRLATSNVGDFVTLCKAAEVHAGVALIEEVGLRRAEQLERLETVVEILADLPDMINRAFMIRRDRAHQFFDIP